MWTDVSLPGSRLMERTLSRCSTCDHVTQDVGRVDARWLTFLDCPHVRGRDDDSLGAVAEKLIGKRERHERDSGTVGTYRGGAPAASSRSGWSHERGQTIGRDAHRDPSGAPTTPSRAGRNRLRARQTHHHVQRDTGSWIRAWARQERSQEKKARGATGVPT